MVALLLHVRHSDATAARLGSAAGLSARLSAAALTAVSGPCSGRLVGGHVRVTGPADAVAAFRAAAAQQGLGVGLAGSVSRSSTTGRPGAPGWWRPSTDPTSSRAATRLSGWRRTAPRPVRWTLPWASWWERSRLPEGCRCGCGRYREPAAEARIPCSSTRSRVVRGGGTGVRGCYVPGERLTLVQPTARAGCPHFPRHVRRSMV